MTVWLNGALRPSAFSIDAQDRGFSIGDGVFETFLVRGGRAVFVEAHFVRLLNGLDLLRINTAFSPGEFARAVREICDADAIAGDASARLTISRGVGPRWAAGADGAPATVVVTADAVAQPPPRGPLALAVAPYRRHAGAAAARFKAIGGYVEHLLARRWAADNAYDDAVMLNEFGRVACATTSNLFVIGENGIVKTPAVSEGALPGIVRACLIASASSHGMAIVETEIGILELETAVLALTSSIAGVRRARLCTDESTPSPAALKSFELLEQWYRAAVDADLNKSRQKSQLGAFS